MSSSRRRCAVRGHRQLAVVSLLTTRLHCRSFSCDLDKDSLLSDEHNHPLRPPPLATFLSFSPNPSRAPDATSEPLLHRMVRLTSPYSQRGAILRFEFPDRETCCVQ